VAEAEAELIELELVKGAGVEVKEFLLVEEM
jgi:hypothetical protein